MTSLHGFGHWLRERRHQLDMTQDELAHKVGCSTITIRKIESDERRPSRQIALRLAQCLCIPEHDMPAFIGFARGISLAFANIHQSSDSTNNPRIPIPLTSLIGREQELGSILSQIRNHANRLLTIVGPPGIGKTRLSLELAHQLLRDFDQRVAFIELAALSDPQLVVSTIAHSLGLNVSVERSFMELLKETFQQPWVLVLDNMEHLLESASDLADLLQSCEQLQILATSRAALRIRGEQLIPIAPLAVPEPAQSAQLSDIASTASVQLFIERAQANNPAFHLSTGNAEAIAAICRRLDGLPLAIELVATHTTLFTAEALLEHLKQQPILQMSGLRDMPERHQSLQTAIDWSYATLTSNQQILFRRLGVFVGSWSLESAQVITALDQALFVKELMSLLEQSLMRTVPGNVPRFTMLETIREYALQCLHRAGEAEHFFARKAEYYVQQAERAQAQLSSDQQDETLSLIELRHEQYRSVLQWCLHRGSGVGAQGSGVGLKQDSRVPEEAADFVNIVSFESWCLGGKGTYQLGSEDSPQDSGKAMLGLRLAAALWPFWYTRCYLSEGRRWLMQALGLTPDTASPVRVQAILGAGVLAQEQGDHQEAHKLFQESLKLARQLQDQPNIAQICYYLGRSSLSMDDMSAAVHYHETCLEIQRQLHDQEGIARALNGLGNMLLLNAEYERAYSLLDEALSIQRQLHNMRGIAFTLHSLGMLGLEYATRCTAADYFHEALPLFRQLRDRIGIADCLAGLAAAAAVAGRPVRARRLWASAERLRERIAAPLSPAECALYQRHLQKTNQPEL